MIYYEEIVPFEPDGKDGHWHEDYWKEFNGRLAPTMSRLGIPVVGVWETPPGAGQGSECVFLYRTESYTTYGEFIARTHGATVDPVVHKRRGEMWVYRQRWFTKILLTTPGHEVSLLKGTEGADPHLPGSARSPLPRTGEGKSLYYHERIEFEPDGKHGNWRVEYWKRFCADFVPTMKRLGLELVGSWETPVGSGPSNEITFLWRTRDYASFGEYVSRAKSDAGIKKWKADSSRYWREWFSQLLTTAPGHETSLLRERVG